MNCVYCGTNASGPRHEGICPYNPNNIYKILMFLKEYVEARSKFNKRFKPFPNPKEFDRWLRENKIMRMKTIRKRYLVEEIKLEEWFTELLSIALEQNVINYEDFPVHLLYLYDAYLFKSKEEYAKAYEMAIEYEDAAGMMQEIGVVPIFSLPAEAVPFVLE